MTRAKCREMKGSERERDERKSENSNNHWSLSLTATPHTNRAISFLMQFVLKINMEHTQFGPFLFFPDHPNVKAETEYPVSGPMFWPNYPK